jgi:TrmH family RNA methyltransferase
LKYITSGANAVVRRARKLLQKKGRDAEGAFIIEGFVLIGDAVRAGLEIERIFLRGPYSDEMFETELRPLLMSGDESSAAHFEALALAEDIFDGLAGTVTPKNAIAVAKKPRRTTKGPEDALLVLDRLQDPGNVGALMRTADALGIDGVLGVKGTADPFSPKSCRAAAGALFRLSVYEGGGPEETLAMLMAEGYRVIVLGARGVVPCWAADLTGRVALVVGNEGGGVSSCFIGSADVVVSIPMTEGAESLNAAVAAGMAMYERRRQSACPARSR